VIIADALAEGWYDHEGPRMHEIDRLRLSKLKPGAVVYDCGAHQCVVAMILASVCGPQGRVIAVEANAHNADIARQNINLNQAGRAPVEIIQAALAGHLGALRFNENLNGQISHKSNRDAGQVEVRAVTLNSLTDSHPRPDVIFLDLEGAESDALKACDRVFANGNRPDWFVEVHAGEGLEDLGGSAEEIVAFFCDRGYAVEASVNDGEPFAPLTATPRGRFLLIALAQDCAEIQSPGLTSYET